MVIGIHTNNTNPNIKQTQQPIFATYIYQVISTSKNTAWTVVGRLRFNIILTDKIREPSFAGIRRSRGLVVVRRCGEDSNLR